MAQCLLTGNKFEEKKHMKFKIKKKKNGIVIVSNALCHYVYWNYTEYIKAKINRAKSLGHKIL